VPRGTSLWRLGLQVEALSGRQPAAEILSAAKDPEAIPWQPDL
jgi:hypothetical protein